MPSPNADNLFKQGITKRIEAVIEYMVCNLNGNISLKDLSSIANFSPFHFQKLFKELIGISPKQYMIKLRLETALHLMIIHPQRSIKEVSIDCGYSSPAIFTRSITNYFGLSPQIIRQLSAKERMELYIQKRHRSDRTLTPHLMPTGDTLIVETKTTNPLQGIHLIVPSMDAGQIQHAFYQLLQIARSHDLYDPRSRMLGILLPHQTNVYKAFLSIDHVKKIPGSLEQTKINAGKYAAFFVKGGQMDTICTAHQFLQQWLPASNYKIGNGFCFESFSQDPSEIAYSKLERKLFVPIAARN